MELLHDQLKVITQKAITQLYGVTLQLEQIVVQDIKENFNGDYAIVLFALSKQLKKTPLEIGNALGTFYITHHAHIVEHYEMVKGFLNLTIAQQYCVQFVHKTYQYDNFGVFPKNGLLVLVEFSSPNTNKPLHLGHLRNNFLGASIIRILTVGGYETISTCVVNDRGIHICKSMVAWKKYAQGATPETNGLKGDHFVGDYYVLFNTQYQKEVNNLMEQYLQEETASIHPHAFDDSIIKISCKERATQEAPIMKEAKQMLKDWEEGKPDVIDLWKRMNQWVYEGFATTYKSIDVHFDTIYYESDLYLLGKDLILEGLKNQVFYKKEDGSIWINLEADGLESKLVMRADGTSVYITQDIGLAKLRFDTYKPYKSIYIIGDEQNHHMQALKIICERLKIYHQEAGIHHLSYGMVELPLGKMKSREGTVVDADDIIAEMIIIAQKKTIELGKIDHIPYEDLLQLYKTIGLGALKFFLLHVDPSKKIIFNPEKSTDLQGVTAAFIQYAYARIQNICKKQPVPSHLPAITRLSDTEKKLVLSLERFPLYILHASKELNPAILTNYIYHIAHQFNHLYAVHSILQAETEEQKTFRLQLCLLTAQVIKKGMALLCIDVPNQM